MSWFQRLCRNTGLMIHHVIKPLRKSDGDKKVLKKEVEEKQIDEKTILRRTTIEEIEVRRDAKENGGEKNKNAE